MTKDELRIAVAEAQGWTEIRLGFGGVNLWGLPPVKIETPEDAYYASQTPLTKIPNFPDSMDVCMALVEEVNRSIFSKRLSFINKLTEVMEEQYPKDMPHSAWWILLLKPDMICKAYLKWSEVWKEGE